MKSNQKYIPRLAEITLQRKLNSCGAVLVTGPKFCGKSTMCSLFSRSIIQLKTNASIELANADPKSVLSGKSPRLINERQKAPEIWNYIKGDLDDEYVFGKYILTGSTTPRNPKKIQNSAAGRITKMMLRPFTLFESNESLGIVSLENLFNESYSFKTLIENENPISLRDIAYFICRGGWPVSIKAAKENAINVTQNYFDSLFTLENESDEFSDFLKNKDITLLKLILESFARNIATQAKNTSMIKDILSSGQRSTLDDDTFLSYKKILEDLFIIYDMPAWNLNLRTSVTVRTAPTHHFVDTSIATAALGISPDDLLSDLHSFGYFFEDFVVRDLMVYSECFGAELKHYRDSSGLEVDTIIKLRNGKYAAIEIKIASKKNIKEGLKSLRKFKSKVIESELKEPSFMMIVTSHGSCYKTEDGIFIVPINCLKN